MQLKEQRGNRVRKMKEPQRNVQHLYNTRMRGGKKRNNIERKKCLKISQLVKNTNLHIHGAQQYPIKTNRKKSTPRHITVKMLKAKEKILTALRENDFSCTKKLK